jgi:hypothetical protein
MSPLPLPWSLPPSLSMSAPVFGLAHVSPDIISCARSLPGATQRETDPTTGQTKKVQGPLTGFLAAVGFQAHQVYKF